MKLQKALLLAFGSLLLVVASTATVFFAYRTFSTTGQHAVAAMSPDELATMKLLLSINREMSTDDVYQILGSPSEDLYFFSKWDGLGGSVLSQARVYFENQHPTRIRWMKLGFFFYEKTL